MDEMFTIFFVMLYAFVAIAPLFLAPNMAKKKNRSAGKALLLVLFTGWLGVLMVYALEAKQVCKKCNAKFPANQLVCSVCGKKK